MNERADIAVIGSGPAGVSAAITAVVRNKKVILFGDMSSQSKLGKAHQIANYPGLYGVSGFELQEALKRHLDALHIIPYPQKITNVYAMGSYFTLLSGQEQFEAKSIIVATGVSFGKPLPGENQFLGHGVSYCATCDGMLYRNKKIAVIGYSKTEEKEVNFLAELSNKLYYVPLYKEPVAVDSRCEIIQGTPAAINGSKTVETLSLKSKEGEKILSVDGVFILRDSIPPAQLVEGLAIEENYIVVDRQMRTNISGVFAAGDITGTPYQYIKAAGEGNVAALSAVSYLG
jgi:thioredoxin reductase (NADPH)